MMTERNRRTVEWLLRSWAAGRESTEAQLTELQDRILRRWAEEPAAREEGDFVATETIGNRSARRRRLAAAAAVALCVLAAVAVWLHALPRGRDVSPGGKKGTGLAVPATLEVGRAEALKSVFAEAERLFDGQVTWVAETAEQVRLGLTEDRAADGRRTVVVRLAITRRRPAASDWVLVWWLDVLCRPEEVVCVTQNRELGDLYLWAYLLPDGMVAVDTQLNVEAPVSVRAGQSALYRPGESKVLLAGSDHGVEYRVLQTVAVLDGGKREAG